jgi:hypothetical protein
MDRSCTVLSALGARLRGRAVCLKGQVDSGGGGPYRAGMTDIDRLGRRLRGGWTALMLAAGCTGAGTGTGVPADPRAPEVPRSVPEVPVVLEMPTCPSGTWSGPVALAVKLKLGDEFKNGCPQHVARGVQTLDAGEQLAVEGLPPGVYGTLAETVEASAGQCAYRWVQQCPGGRVLVGDDGVVLAEVEEDAGWAMEVEGGERDAALAEAWSSDARMEHASIASFARATLELLAVGAPPALVSATQQASLDEVEHARLCFALASRYAGRELGPGPLAVVGPRSADLVRLACDVFVEGCVGETIAALAAVRAGRGCEDEVVREVLAKIADDEARHAAVAWATLGWACERGGEAVREAVRGLAAVMRDEVFAEEELVAEVSRLARHGRLDAAGQQACVRAAWAALIPGALVETVG